jgi:hypothetical protein
MSELSVEKISNKTGTGPTDFADGLTVDGVTLESDYGFVPMTLIESNGTPSDSASNRGNLWWNDSDGTLAIYNNDAWLGISGAVSGGGGGSPWYGDRAVMAGGSQGFSTTNYIDYRDITTTGNTSTFGTLTVASSGSGTAGADATYVVFATTYEASGDGMDYVTVATTGNASDFGDITDTSNTGWSAANDGTYAVFLSLYANSGVPMEYVTVATTGNATSFGTGTHSGMGGACNNGTYGVWAGGSGSNGNLLSYVTVATTGNALDFGDLTYTANSINCGMDDGTYGVWAGGYVSGTAQVNNMDYVTLSTPGNASDFGDLTAARYSVGGASNDTRGIAIGGYPQTNVIDYVTIATPGNATDFGDLYYTNNAGAYNVDAGSGNAA